MNSWVRGTLRVLLTAAAAGGIVAAPSCNQLRLPAVDGGAALAVGTPVADGDVPQPVVLPAYVPAGAIVGASVEVLGNTMQSWVVPEGSTASEVGFLFPLSVVQQLSNAASGFIIDLPLPQSAIERTAFRSIRINLVPTGHVPKGVYDVNHFEVHFQTIDLATSEAIDCSNSVQPTDAEMPPEFFTVQPFFANCFPRFGIHVYDNLSPEFKGERFSASVALNYYAGQNIAIELKIASPVLLERRSEVDLASAMARATAWRDGTASPKAFYPTSSRLRYIAQEDGMVVSISSFAERK